MCIIPSKNCNKHGINCRVIWKITIHFQNSHSKCQVLGRWMQCSLNILNNNHSSIPHQTVFIRLQSKLRIVRFLTLGKCILMVKLLGENSSLSQNLIKLYTLILLGVQKKKHAKNKWIYKFLFPAAIKYNM